MSLEIRQATPNDATYIAPLIYEAIGEIAHRLTGETSKEDVLKVLVHMVQTENNRHAYKNTYVAIDQKLLGIVVLYDGKQGYELDTKWMAYLAKKGVTAPIEVEAHADEFYIDTVCVTKQARGKGIGTKLLSFAEQQGRVLGYKKLALNVEEKKDNARKLYLSRGFSITEPWTIIGEKFDHMVKDL